MFALVEITCWHWVGFIACVLIFLALDLGVFHRHAHTVKFKEALLWSIVWFSLAMLFALALKPLRGEQGGPPIRHRLSDRAVALDGQRLRHRPHLRLFPRPAPNTSIASCTGAFWAR